MEGGSGVGGVGMILRMIKIEFFFNLLGNRKRGWGLKYIDLELKK